MTIVCHGRYGQPLWPTMVVVNRIMFRIYDKNMNIAERRQHEGETMKILIKTILITALPFLAMGTYAETTQDCILEGTIDKSKAEKAGKNVYVEFHSARKAEPATSCNLNRRNKLEFKEPKNAMIENAPDGAQVKYRYTEEDNKDPQWQLIGISML